jgi:hypothetical protein
MRAPRTWTRKENNLDKQTARRLGQSSGKIASGAPPLAQKKASPLLFLFFSRATSAVGVGRREMEADGDEWRATYLWGLKYLLMSGYIIVCEIVLIRAGHSAHDVSRPSLAGPKLSWTPTVTLRPPLLPAGDAERRRRRRRLGRCWWWRCGRRRRRRPSERDGGARLGHPVHAPRSTLLTPGPGRAGCAPVPGTGGRGRGGFKISYAVVRLPVDCARLPRVCGWVLGARVWGEGERGEGKGLPLPAALYHLWWAVDSGRDKGRRRVLNDQIPPPRDRTCERPLFPCPLDHHSSASTLCPRTFPPSVRSNTLQVLCPRTSDADLLRRSASRCR